MSKKLATGVDGIVLDVKVGDGAFMKTLHDARKLARLMIDIGKNLGKQVVALLTPMDQPLGKEIGNLNEVQEAVRLLKNEKYDKQLMEVSLEVAAQMVSMSTHFKNKNIEEIKAKLRTQIVNGKAYEKFCELVEIQGGETDTIFTQYATNEYVIKSKENGYIEKIKTEELGYIASQLGAGRKKKDDQIDHHAGVSIEVKLGDFVRKGQVLLRARTNKVYEKELEVRMQRAVVMNDKKRTRIVSPILDIIQ